MEVDVVITDRGERLDLHVHKTEAERTLPDGTRHVGLIPGVTRTETALESATSMSCRAAPTRRELEIQEDEGTPSRFRAWTVARFRPPTTESARFRIVGFIVLAVVFIAIIKVVGLVFRSRRTSLMVGC